MFAKDHNPPHFHAKYGEYVGVFNVQTVELIEGELPKRALRLIKEWSIIHKQELMRNWDIAQSDNPEIQKIQPLY